MKRLISLLLCILMISSAALAEGVIQACVDSSLVGVWIENEGYGTLTLFADGTSEMIYYDNTVTECHWNVTADGARFLDGQWYNSPMTLLDANTLSVADGWMIFTREGFLPTTDPALLLNAQPVGEEGAPFLGKWNLVSIISDGTTMSPDLLGMYMALTFNADGTVLSEDDLDAYTTTWFVSYGNAVMEGHVLFFNEEGQLVTEDEETVLIFSRDESQADAPSSEADDAPPEAAGTPSEDDELLALLALFALMEEASDLPEDHRGFVGQWHLCYVATGGLTGDLRQMGVTGMLTLEEDYTGVISGVADESSVWYEDEEGTIRFGEVGMPMYLLGDATSPSGVFLQYGSQMGGYMIFSLNEHAVWDPAAYELQPPAPAVTSAPAASAAVPAPAAAGTRPLFSTRYVCTTYTAGGYTADAAMLGVEYALYFREDGTCDLTIAGATVSNLPYSINESGVYVINYFGTPFHCIPTEAGIDLDFYGTMTLHCTPAQ